MFEWFLIFNSKESKCRKPDSNAKTFVASRY